MTYVVWSYKSPVQKNTFLGNFFKFQQNGKEEKKKKITWKIIEHDFSFV